MRRILTLVALGFGGSLVVGACTMPQSPPPAGAPADPDGKALIAAFKAQPEGAYTLVSTEGIPSQFHGDRFDYYVSKAHAAQYKDLKGMAPEGMVVIKRSTTNPDKVYLMQKVAGYDPQNQDWYYATSTAADSSLGASGRPQMCISCHAGWKPTDYLGGPGIEAVRAKLK